MAYTQRVPCHRSVQISAYPVVLFLWLVSLGLPFAASQAEDWETHYGLYLKAIKENDLNAAVIHARRASLESNRERGPRDPQSGVLAYNLGVVNLELGRFSDSARALQEALLTYEELYGRDDVRVTKPLIQLATARKGLRQWTPAEKDYVRALQILRSKKSQENDLTAGLVLVQLTQVAEAINDPKRIRSYGLRSLSQLRKSGNQDSIAVANLHVAVAGAEIQLGNGSEARKHMERAMALYEDQLDPNDPQFIGIYEFAARLYEQTGKTSTARKYRKRVQQARQKE
ncbi:MAG: tetratricopeptide repeat protein [Myxococcota bacterium]|nr:tetratricopeptide repeat protein [Myxococcota bacterium]